MRAVAVVVAAWLMVGCTTGTPPEVETQRERMLTQIHETLKIRKDVTDNELVSIATDVCFDMGEGVTLETILASIETDETLTDEQVYVEAGVVGAAIRYLCPTHVDQVQDFLGEDFG